MSKPTIVWRPAVYQAKLESDGTLWNLPIKCKIVEIDGEQKASSGSTLYDGPFSPPEFYPTKQRCEIAIADKITQIALRLQLQAQLIRDRATDSMATERQNVEAAEAAA